MRRNTKEMLAATGRAGTGLAICLMLGMAVSGCADDVPGTSSEAKPGCDGTPNWCVAVSNEMAYEVRVYVDGRLAATAESDGSANFSLPANEARLVNYCRDGGNIITGRKNLCSRPAPVTLTGNQVKVIFDGSMFPPSDR